MIGTGVDASWRIAAGSGTAIGVVFEGGAGIIDPDARKNVFRIAPTDHGIAFRLAEYMVPKGYRIAFLHDDTSYGQQGAVAFQDAFGHTPNAVVSNIGVSFTAQEGSTVAICIVLPRPVAVVNAACSSVHTEFAVVDVPFFVPQITLAPAAEILNPNSTVKP